MASHLSAGWTGDWRTLSVPEMLARADALVVYGNSLPDGVTTEAFAEVALIRREAAKLSSCDARIRPFPGPTEVTCEQTGDHDRHSAVLRDYAYPGSETVITWLESDRRTYHGEWPGLCNLNGCPLPDGHRGRHA